MYAKVSAAIDWIKEITNYQDPGILESRVDTTTPSARDVIIQNLSYPDSLFDIIEQGKYLVESKESHLSQIHSRPINRVYFHITISNRLKMRFQTNVPLTALESKHTDFGKN